MQKLLLAVLLTAASACAQGISVGVIGGVPFTAVESTTTIDGVSYLPKNPYFVVGPTVQLNLPFHLRLEFDALARPADFKASDMAAKTTATEWRFPIIMQYRIGHNKFMQPYLGVGASFEHLYQIGNAVTSGPGSIATNSPGGMLVEGGLDFKVKLFRISAALRYTRQFNSTVLDLSQLNQAECLVGARF